MRNTDEQRLIEDVGTKLHADYQRLPSTDVQDTIDSCVSHFDGVRIRDYVPLLVDRRARAILGSPS